MSVGGSSSGAGVRDPQSVLRAIAECDELGQSAFLAKYGFRPAKAWFLLHEGREYPSKAILGVAHRFESGTALKPSQFSGGDAAAAKVLRALGFDVVDSVRMPDWSSDELILALDLYVTSLDWSSSEKEKAAAELSELLRHLPVFSQEVRTDPRFRTSDAVGMKLANFRSIDPEYAGAGMPHKGTGDRRIWDEWRSRPDELHSVAQSLRDGVATTSLPPNEEEDEEEYGANEGRLLYRRHRSYERDRKLVDKKKSDALRRTGRLACEVCDFDSGEVFGPDLAGVIDVHHVEPLSKTGQRKNTVADLSLLCPTCHRAIHKHDGWISPSELRALRKG